MSAAGVLGADPRIGVDPFAAPPADPVACLRAWLDEAREAGVREPGALALATTDAHGRASCRIVQTVRVDAEGLVFTTHATSRKGRDLAATGRSAGVLYWREAARQITLAGPTHPLSDAESDAVWDARPVSTHPMSAAAEQSAPLRDEDGLRARARALGAPGTALPRPAAFLAYRLAPDEIEFWQSGEDRLHRRLRYDHGPAGWVHDRLQP